MPDTIPSPAVGDIAELTLKNGRKVLTEWSGEHWCQINLPNCWWPVEYVTSVRPLRLVDADAVVIDLQQIRFDYKGADESDAMRMREIARRLEHDYPIGGQHSRAGVARILRAIAAVVPDEGGGENAAPLTESTTCHQPQSGTKGELRTDEDRAFVLRTVADVLSTLMVATVSPAVLARTLTDEADRLDGIRVHYCPRAGESLTRCCGKSPLELPAMDRLTADHELVTCGGRR